MTMGVAERLARIDEDTILAEVPIDEMFVPPFQRTVGPSALGRMLKSGFDKRKLGVITLSMRHDGRYAIIDGNHRRHLATNQGITRMLARVYIDLTYEEEAKLFVALNTIKPPTALDKFRARLEFRDPMAVEMNTLLEQHGLRVGDGGRKSKEGTISCITSMEKLFIERGPLEFAEVINVIHTVWQTDRMAWHGRMVDGFRQFWSRYRDDIDFERLVNTLIVVNPAQVLRAAGAISVQQDSPATLIGKQLAVLYNGKSRAKKLAEWPDRVKNPASSFSHTSVGKDLVRRIEAARAAARPAKNPFQD